MNIKFQGFELTLEGTAISWSDFVNYLLSLRGTETRYGPFNRILCLDVEENEEYILGLFVSIKDQKRFCEIRDTGGQFELVSHDLEKGARLADFNFFILSKANLRGLFQYYHQSCSLKQFLTFLERQFNFYRKQLSDSVSDAVLVETVKDRKLKDIRDSQFGGQVLVRRDTFDELLEQLDEIREMKFDIATYEDDSPWFSPMRDVARKRTERVLFTKGVVSLVRQSIRKIAHSNDLNNVRVKGVSSKTGIETTIRLFENLEDFGVYDYDDLTEHLFVELESFTESQLLSLLISAADENYHIFE